MWWRLSIAFILGFGLCFLLVFILVKRIRKSKGKRISLNTFSKLIVTLVMAHGMILTTFSYILAFMGMDPVVDVSSTIVREIVAPVLTYLATNTIMNIFEKNKLAFSIPLNSMVIDSQGNKITANDEAVG